MSNRFQRLFHALWCRASSLSYPVGAGRRQPRFGAALRDRPVSGGVEGDDFLHGRRASLLQLHSELVRDEAGLLNETPLSLSDLAVAQQTGAGSQRYPHPGLGGLALQVDRLVIHLVCAERL